ncbi:hypothetical protein DERP_009492 [Dermatophagoides pteronyssinus]|uniref:Uncharacterized protein n=1 Tax=Dermatophagoides pteronyssinus TaxID=6956 RepID=A0ABQ8IUA9_DERPT|nr:hypothetical protein DERP_009492 [Dermatophagoides pteronyssinus]
MLMDGWMDYPGKIDAQKHMNKMFILFDPFLVKQKTKAEKNNNNKNFFGKHKETVYNLKRLETKENITLEEDKLLPPSSDNDFPIQESSKSRGKHNKQFNFKPPIQNQQPYYDTPYKLFYILIGISVSAFFFVIYYLNMKDLQLRTSPSLRIRMMMTKSLLSSLDDDDDDRQKSLSTRQQQSFSLQQKSDSF